MAADKDSVEFWYEKHRLLEIEHARLLVVLKGYRRALKLAFVSIIVSFIVLLIR